MIGLLLWLILGVVLIQWRTGAEREFIQACHDRVDHDLPSLDEIDVASLQRAPLSVRHWWTLLRLSLRRQADPILEEKRRRLHGRTAIAFGAMSATAPIALASTVYPDVAAGLAALFLGATFLAFRRRFARFTLAQQDSFWGFGFPQTGTALAFTEVIVAVVSGGTVLWGIWVLALHFNPNQPTTNLRDVYRDLADVQREMDFQIVVPCWLPDSLNAQPTVEKLSSDTVELSYRSPAQLGLPLRIIEQSAEGLRLVRVGESVGIDGAEARLTDAPPGGEVALEFIKDDIRYDMVCSCGREAISMIARSMLSGCKEGG